MQSPLRNTQLLEFTLLLACSAFLQPAAGATLGSVTELKEPCQRGVGRIPNTACMTLEVSCPQLKPHDAQLRVTEPAAGVPYRGTVVMASGGSGTEFYADQEGGRILVGEIAAMGFRVADRAWDRPGWGMDGVGLVPESCRFATLLTWIHDHIHKGGKFVTTGNSGGSAEISYALTTWERGDILDVAIPTSGPPQGRLDYACVSKALPEWAALCASIVPKGVMECASSCLLGPPRSPVNSFVYKAGVCRQVSPDETPQQLLEDSVVHPGAVLNYPKTKLFFLYGAHDCGEPVPNGLTYATAVTSEKTIRFVPHTPHAVFSTAEGRAAIKQAIEEGIGGAAGGK
jgi:hypothetical protein